ncbi:MAG TPA: TolC family protein [Thermoanaerobaculaceae bacterium]|nr:TolC family protein [Thermoanaerobaculaceae bacterium]
MIANLALVLAATAPAAAPRILTLDEALTTARARQPQMRQAVAATQAAVARADESLAPLLPQVSGNGTYTRETANFASRPGSLPNQISGSSSGESWNTANYFNLGLNASVLLYDFGQTSSRWRASQASAAAQKDSEHTTLAQVLFAVRTAYFQARAAKGLVRVASDTLANQQKHMQQTEGFVEVGTQPEISLAQAKTDVANAKVQLINAENGYETAKAQLNLAMGVEHPEPYDVADETLPPVAGEDGTTDVLLDEAVKARPELAALANQVRAEEMTLRAVRGAYGPSLGLSTGFSDAGEQASNLTWNWNAAVTLSVPIFQGGQTKAQVREAEANLSAIRAQLDGEMQQVRLEIEQARLAVRAAKAALDASAEALANAKVQLQLAEGRYETGVGSIIELGDSQVSFTSAAQQKVQAEYNLAQARAGLVKALGRD